MVCPNLALSVGGTIARITRLLIWIKARCRYLLKLSEPSLQRWRPQGRSS